MGTRPTTLEAVLAALASGLPALAEHTCATIYAELDTYASVGSDALTAAVRRNLDTALTALRERRVPDPDHLDGAAVTARERFEAGVPVEEIVRGFRISIALIHERFVDLAVSDGLPADETVAGVRVLWGVGDAFTTRIITAYHGLEVAAALTDATRRTAAVASLLAGRWPDEADALGLDRGVRYAAIRGGAVSEAGRVAIQQTGSLPGAHALVVLVDGACVGVVATRPDTEVPLGLGPFVPIEQLPRSDRVAGQALTLAERLGRAGVQGVEELGWRLAAASRPDVGGVYTDRFVTPVADEGDFGVEVLAAVRAWLHHGRSVARASEALTVHPNTVRYRLARYAALTGSDLDQLDDLIGAAWALDPAVGSTVGVFSNGTDGSMEGPPSA